MKEPRPRDARIASQTRWPLIVLGAVAMISAGLYGWITHLSGHFEHDTPDDRRPIVLVLCIYWTAFLLYLAAIWFATRARQDRVLPAMIWGGAILFRMIALPSAPIQEVDIYRYLWDGAAQNAGVSPYRYSPDQVRVALERADRGEPLPPAAGRLAAAVLEDESLGEVLKRVHHGHLPTIYPPVSQVVFAVTDAVTPAGASLATRLNIMKTVLLLFDLGTLWLVFAMLCSTGCSPGWAIAYGWCPLVIKEVANSGHLDAIAVFFTALAIYLAVRVAGAQAADDPAAGPPMGQAPSRSQGAAAWALSLAAAVALALGVGAKLYPIVLAPVVAVWLIRQAGWKPATTASLVFLATTTALLWPMLGARPDSTKAARLAGPQQEALPEIERMPAGGDAALGLKTFLRRWEMNDLLFLLVFENLRPAVAEEAAHQRPWFVVTRDQDRAAAVRQVQKHVDLNERDSAFLLARLITLGVFGLVTVWLMAKTWRGDAGAFLRAVFLSLAWFWLLSPTQNPWYWLWAVPFLPLARCRAWLAVSGLAMLYYLRFPLAAAFPAPGPNDPADFHTTVWGTPYYGENFFHFVVVFLEFGPLLLVLATEAAVRVLAERRSNLE